MGKAILIVLAGNTFPAIRDKIGDFDRWIADGLGDGTSLRLFDPRVDDAFPDHRTLPASSSADRTPW